MVDRAAGSGYFGRIVSVVHVALLRGINVGKAKRVAMAELRRLVADLGYGDVRTLLNSGNVVFTAPREARKAATAALVDALPIRLGVPAPVTVITAAELAEAVAQNPLSGLAETHSRMLVAFLANPGDRGLLEPLAARDWAPEAFALGRRVAYLWCPGGVLACAAARALGEVLHDRVTTRNWSTVIKLDALARK
jgi:uncharacterized protein (DUF1697 family)